MDFSVLLKQVILKLHWQNKTIKTFSTYLKLYLEIILIGIFLDFAILRLLKNICLRWKMDELSLLSFSLSFPSVRGESIRSHLQTTIHPQTPGITKVLFFKAGPVHLLPRVCGCGSREGGKLLRPCSPCTPLPVACLLGGSPLRVS